MKKINIKKSNNIDIINKTNNRASIRVLYKKVGQVPKVKIINDLRALKKTIIKKKLEIIAFQNVFIICHNYNQRKYLPINIILDFCNISGDFIVVHIDKNKREFKSLPQEDIIWFTNVLNNKTPIFNETTNNLYSKDTLNYFSSETKTFDSNQNNKFENRLLDVLTNIELTLSCLLTSKEK